ncbi:MAG: radical SAM protein [Candidatus Hadarchaeota archaeon]|nr:radical SAM protein [Candidatus Hadarchaeota archaeon]
MRALFIEPPVRSRLHRFGVTGIPSTAYLAPVLEEEGYEVKIVDSPTLGYELSDVREEIKGFNPELVGITSTTPAIYDAYKVAKVAKELNPTCTTVIGGPHPTFTAKQTLKECLHLDIAVRGEGEETIREIAFSKDLESIEGITYRKNGKIVENESRPPIMDLDSLPFPAYHLLPMGKYKAGGSRYATMVTSRGCPFNCIFCSSSRICGKVWRGKSPQRVLEQIELLLNEYGVREIEMLDDTFTLNKNRARKICDLIIEEGLDVSWSCSSRVDTIDRSLAEKLKEAGCHTVYMGIESGTQKILDHLKKGISLGQIKKAVKVVKKAGLNPVGSFILGVPGETKKQMKGTIEFAKKLGLTLAQFTLLTPYPGTEVYEMARKNNLLLMKDWSKYTTLDPVMKVRGMTAKELKRTVFEAYLSFYLRFSYIWESIKGGRFWSFLKILGGGGH